ncbi:hypothetical protein CONLIGDRAFT_629761 [Coniochaeta ligniaria NRRL 30616]|uniref:SYO1-like TPR repeats domain-containing protein n=1 Tax=Coniochaeta ligniaria NRRL 30616 TaxID=1408157 RepID=A0A1J7IXP0_9PEZI|nr:hypothetical protein CONLIGDRAFT_629761 [Coniochaeta ligniaria NRRL 30616]
MGKSRQNRKKGARSDPIAKPVKPLSDPVLIALRESRILPVVKNLQSPDIKNRTAAAGAIANIVQDAKCRKLLLREQIVHIVLTETLTDSSIESRAAGWNILRVLVQEEESDFAVHLFRLDILTAIEYAGKAVVNALTSSETPFAKTPKAQQERVWETASCLVFLTGALAVARDEILQAVVANRTILRFLFFLVANTSTPADLLDEVLFSLMALSEENIEFGQALVDDQETHCYNQLLKLKDSGGSRAMLSCGVLHNVFFSLEWQDGSLGVDDASDAILVPSIVKVMEQSSLTQTPNGNHGAEPADVLQIAFEVLASIGADFQSALERLNKQQKKTKPRAKPVEEWDGFEDGEPMEEDEPEVPASEDEAADDEEVGEDDEESDDEMDQDELEEDMELVTGADDDVPEESSLEDLPTLKSLIQMAVPQCIKWTQIPLDSDEAVAVQSLAFSALNNIAWTVSCFDFSNQENMGIYRAWAPTAKKIWSKSVATVLESDTADLKLATVVTSIAWAVSRSLGGNTPLKGDEHRRFMVLYQASKGRGASDSKAEAEEEEDQDPFQGLGVKCIGVLGQLARDPAPVDRNREIGVFLLTVLSGLPATPAADAIEALNQFIDIYGDKNAACDKAVFWKDDFLRHLDEITRKVKVMAKGIDKRRFGELRERADEAIVNLRKFVTYKKKNAPK